VEITKEALETMYRNKSLNEMTRELDITKPTIYRLLKANGISLKGRRPKEAKVKVVG